MATANTTSNAANWPQKPSFPCRQCPAIFTRAYHMRRHVESMHNNVRPVLDCLLCGAYFHKLSDLRNHRRMHRPSTGFKLLRGAFTNNCTIYRKIYPEKMESLQKAFVLDHNDIVSLLNYVVLNKKLIKASVIVTAEFVKMSALQEVEEIYKICFRTPASTLRNLNDVADFVQSGKRYIAARVDDFVAHGSGWILDEILFTDVELGTCRALNGSCNLLTVTFPKTLKRIPAGSSTSKTNDCFFQAVAYHFVKNAEQKKLNRFIRRRMITKVKTPVSIHDLKSFENDNPKLKMKLNVLYSEDEGRTTYPLYTSNTKSTNNIVNLLLWKTAVDGVLVSHYSYITDLGKFLRKKYTYNIDESMTSYQNYFVCGNCLCSFSSKAILNKHEELCLKCKTQTTVIPEKDTFIEFLNFKKKFKVRYAGFFDLEACLKPLSKCLKCAPDDVCSHKSIAENEQVPITYSYLIVDTLDNSVVHQNTYTGEDCMQHFLDEILDIETELVREIESFMPMTFSSSDQLELNDTIEMDHICHICEEFIPTHDMVRDHCHFTGKFIGPAHSLCNLQRSEARFIPFFAHNFTSYDSHFLIQALKNDERITKISALPLNSEKFRTIQINSYHFVDSLSFLNASLHELTTDLVEEKRIKKQEFNILRQMELCATRGSSRRKQQALLLRKGVFPYEYVSSLETLLDTDDLPEQDQFFSKLTNSSVSDDDYAHAQKVYRTFNCAGMKDYCELYCATDTALLAEIILQFREDMYTMFGLDCCHYISLPQMAFDVMLKTTKVKIEKISDPDMLMFFEQNIRGGVSFINQRHCKSGLQPDKEEYVDMLYLDGMYE